ncbi:MAG: glycosyltransferase family 1 protein, partial [Bryobacteraceae bacterium]
HPEYFRWFDLPFWRVMLYAAAHVSRLLLASSSETRADLLRFYRLPESKVRLVPLGVDPRFFAIAAARRERKPKPYILCASTLHPHKNLVPLIRAYAELRKARPELGLVITGVRGFHTVPVENAVRELHLENAVKLTGWVPREELYDLFRDAFAFVYPSLFEGFGLPVLEALAAGIPSACSSIEPLSSMAGSAAVQFDPGDPAALLEALTRLVSDELLRERLAAEGPRRAAEFSWRKTAELTLAALCEASGR